MYCNVDRERETDKAERERRQLEVTLWLNTSQQVKFRLRTPWKLIKWGFFVLGSVERGATAAYYQSSTSSPSPASHERIRGMRAHGRRLSGNASDWTPGELRCLTS